MFLKKYFFLTIMFLVSLSFVGFSQGFEAAAVFGLNASQIDGDDLVGYNKLGLTGGLRINYKTKKKLNGILELLYSQRGSHSEFSFGSPVEAQGLSLSYIEIPIIIRLQDWYQGDGDYHKVRAEAGFSYGYLLNASSSNTSYDDREGLFKTHDLSYLAGLAYAINKQIHIAFRYTRSLNKLIKPEGRGVEGLLSYFITLRSEYHF